MLALLVGLGSLQAALIAQTSTVTIGIDDLFDPAGDETPVLPPELAQFTTTSNGPPLPFDLVPSSASEINRLVAARITLPAGIGGLRSARLRGRVQPSSSTSQTAGDLIILAAITDPNVAVCDLPRAAFYFSSAPPAPTPSCLAQPDIAINLGFAGWGAGGPAQLFDIDLGAALVECPSTCSAGTALELLASEGFIDVLVGDETGVDFLELEYEAVGAVTCDDLSVNSTGRVGRIALVGSTSIGQNDLRLRGTDFPSTQFGLVAMGRNAQSVPAGDLGPCLASPIGRGPVVSTDSAGDLGLALDLSMLAQPLGPVGAVAGETWIFQYWHRDLPSTDPAYRFSRAVEVVVTP
ncbi:MAG: hypothetical protein AAFU73_23815 [Planctomycetota bacterium]